MLGRAADHDVRAVRSILALRQGLRVSRIEDSRFVFLTTNSALSRAAFHQQKAEHEAWVFSAVITDFHLSHLTWLKSPMEAGDLAQTELLASCYAAMRPAQTLWGRYIGEVDRLKAEGRFTAQDHEVLRLSLKAPEELMDVTRGDIAGITEANLRTILNRLERTYAKEKEAEIERLRLDRERIERELTDAQIAARQKESLLSQAADREGALLEHSNAMEREIGRLKAAEAALAVKNQQQRDKIDRISNGLATWAYVATWFVFAVFTGSSLLSNWSLWFAVPAAIVGLFNIAAGFSGKSVRHFVRKRVEYYFSEHT